MKDSNSALIPLRAANDLNLAGGKAVNLAKLLQARLPVPDGFVVSTAAYRSAQQGTLSATLKAEISAALEPFGDTRFAVRSSATAEDMSDASMAGQYDTFLNLETADQVIEAIEKCWASLRTPRTEAYLAEHNIDINTVAMAVVVQQQVSADTAGVLFTVDPQTGSRDNMLIEASWGLGEALVSGEVQPDTIRVACNQTNVLSYEVADKKIALHPGSDRFEEVSQERRQRACLSYEQIDSLRQLGQRAAQHFGAPQDIEWAIEKDQVYMLQARAITTLAETDAFNQGINTTKAYLNDRIKSGAGPWVRHNLGETLPHPTPLTWSLIAPYMSGSGGFGAMHEQLGFKPGPAVQTRSFLERIGGEIYMDCSLMTEMFAEAYPFAYDPEALKSNPDAAQQPPSIATGNFQQLNEASKLAEKAAATIDSLAEDFDRTFDAQFVPELTAWTHKQTAIDLSSLSNTELAEHWNSQRHQVLDTYGAMAFMPSMIEAVAVEALRQALAEHAWDADTALLQPTLSVSRTMDRTLAGNVDLQKLDRDSWLATYGHRATAEFELASPRWNEQSDIFDTLKQQLGDSDLADHHKQRLQDADDCLSQLQSKLKPADFAEIKAATDKVQRYLRFREDGKFHLIKAYSQLRRTALEIGQRLGISEKVFFLTSDELLAALKNGYVPQDRIQQRQLDYRVEPRIQLPFVIESADIETLGQPIVRANGPALKAHSVSNGSASGKVCIVLDPAKAEDFEHGAILVCPSTDPSWTPLFAKAGGLILERGGTLSHGAVVAREMGLAAVVLEGATELFEQGESLSIDAHTGWIYRDGVERSDEEQAIPPELIPPSAGQKEHRANRMGLFAAVIWTVALAAIFLLPPHLLKDPCFTLLDYILWPLIRNFGMIAAVAIIAGFFGLAPVIGQKYLTDNARLYETKRRSGALRKAAAKLSPESQTRKQMETLAGPVTMRILKASMVPLALVLGPMIMIFMWFPARVDPASWNAEPGRMVSIVAEINGECLLPVSLSVPAPLSISNTDVAQTLPDLRKELEELRIEWKESSDLSNLPWEVQSAADHTRMTMLASLDAYLKAGIPAQKITWLIEVPETAGGSHPVTMQIADETIYTFNLVFGQSVPPVPSAFAEVSEDILSIQVNYPRALQKAAFFTVPGTQKDVGWLGIYLLAYLPLMFVSKFCLRVP